VAFRFCLQFTKKARTQTVANSCLVLSTEVPLISALTFLAANQFRAEVRNALVT
jgi:hypothetical protein